MPFPFFGAAAETPRPSVLELALAVAGHAGAADVALGELPDAA